MKRLIRLTESDIRRMVLRAVYEAKSMGSQMATPKQDAFNAWVQAYVDADYQYTPEVENAEANAINEYFNHYVFNKQSGKYFKNNPIAIGLGQENKKNGTTTPFDLATKYVWITNPLIANCKMRYSLGDVQRGRNTELLGDENGQFKLKDKATPIDVIITDPSTEKETLYHFKDVELTIYNQNGDNTIYTYVPKKGAKSAPKQSTVYGQFDMMDYAPEIGDTDLKRANKANTYMEYIGDNDNIGRADKLTASATGTSMSQTGGRRQINATDSTCDMIWNAWHDGTIADSDSDFNHIKFDILDKAVSIMGQGPDAIREYVTKAIRKSIIIFTEGYVRGHLDDLLTNSGHGNATGPAFDRIIGDGVDDEAGDKESDETAFGAGVDTEENPNAETVRTIDPNIDQTELSAMSDLRGMSNFLDCLKWLRSKNQNGKYNIFKYTGTNPAYVDVINALIETIKDASNSVPKNKKGDYKDVFNLGEISYTYYKQLADQELLNSKELSYESYKTYVANILKVTKRDTNNNPLVTDFNNSHDRRMGEARKRKYINHIINETIKRIRNNRRY